MHITDIFALSDQHIKRTGLDFVRYLYDQIDWSSRLIGVKGARGTGKTTLLWQRAAREQENAPYAVYMSLDELYFTINTLIDTIDQLQKTGTRYLYLDEVHKYPNWSREIKLAYDRYPQLKIVFTGSSIIDIAKEEGDLSRRAVMYTLSGLSYREFLAIEHGIKLEPVSLSNVFESTPDQSYPKGFKPLQFFTDYQRFGYYPFYRESKSQYRQLLRQLIRTVVEYDMMELRDFDIANAKKLLRLLGIIAVQVPFKPNLSNLARKSGLHRNTLNNYLQYLEQAHLIRLLYTKAYSTAALQKPDMVFLNNTNLLFALAEQHPNIGTVREHFALSQLTVNHQVKQSSKADFLVDDQFLLEIGGKNKSQKHYDPSVVLVLDHLEYPVAGKIPLWMLGLLY